MGTRLEEIMNAHRTVAANDRRSASELLQRALETPSPRDFRLAITSPGMSIIAEIKRRSPSAGDLNLELDPDSLAVSYVAGGAACLSVLTDSAFFGGSVADLQAARRNVEVPVMRKDFTVDERDVMDARIMGADAVLLIVAGLGDAELSRFAGVARELNLTALFETHDVTEIQRAVDAGAKVIGVNQRNLHTFEIDNGLAASLADAIPEGICKVAESGVRSPDDIARLSAAGYDAALVGTSLVTSAGPQAAVEAMLAGQSSG